MSTHALFNQPLAVINLGLAGFAADVRAAGAQCLHLPWQPPAQGDRAAGWALARLLADDRVDQANAIALQRLLGANPVLMDVVIARQALPGMADGRRLLLHAGPPIAWPDMCGPMRGALLGAVLLEGWADDLGGAQALLDGGSVALAPCHSQAAVGPMAGVISPSMPLFAVHNPQGGNWAYCNFNEGLGKVLRFGAHGPEVITRLRLMAQVLAPALRAALAVSGPIELKPLMAQALNMGDEVHNRNVAATGLFIKRVAGALMQADVPREDAATALNFMAANDHFFLNLSMAACKAMCDAAADVPFSTLVTVMARNGVNFGVRLSGTGDAWFQAPANPVAGLYFAGYSMADAAADLGDSAITETAGVGGFAMAAAPAIVKFVGGTPTDAMHHSLRMRCITLGSNPSFALPALNFAGAAAGIDACRVLDCGVLPVINSGIAHREAGVGQIGAGVTTAPMTCFAAAVQALAQRMPEERR